MRTLLWSPLFLAVVLIAIVPSALPQSTPDTSVRVSNPHATENAEQVAKILGISQLVSNARLMHAQIPCESAATVEELSMRQDILERVVEASFEVDGVLAELDNEHAHLSELSAVLQARRDRAVNLTNVANLITGTGLGIAVNALQFSNATANIGNSLGVVSGIGSTVLSLIGIHLQHGPERRVGRIPNMLALVFARQGALHGYYPPEVLEYLHSVPPGETPESGSRLDQLMAEWRQAGRLGPPGSAETDQKIKRLTSSLDDKTKLSIDDLSDRIAMLADVAGRVALMKRDLGELMLSVRAEKNCGTSANVVDEDWSELTASMDKMHAAMGSIEPSGDSDVDLARLMLPHHQAAIDMAKTELIYGKDPQMRRLAQEIVIDQQSEIELMQLWLKQQEAQK